MNKVRLVSIDGPCRCFASLICLTSDARERADEKTCIHYVLALTSRPPWWRAESIQELEYPMILDRSSYHSVEEGACKFRRDCVHLTMPDGGTIGKQTIISPPTTPNKLPRQVLEKLRRHLSKRDHSLCLSLTFGFPDLDLTPSPTSVNLIRQHRLVVRAIEIRQDLLEIIDCHFSKTWVQFLDDGESLLRQFILGHGETQVDILGGFVGYVIWRLHEFSVFLVVAGKDGSVLDRNL